MTEQKKKQLPPPPSYGTLENAETSIARAVDKLTDREKAIEMMSCIDESDVPRLTLMLTIGQDSGGVVPFAEDYAHTELRLMCSTKQKKGGIRSEQVVEVAKQPPPMNDVGVFGSIKNRLFGGGRR